MCLQASVVVFPEGTIMNWALEKPAVREAFRSIARKNGCQPFEHVLFPKHRGFHRVLNHLEGQLDAVYDLTIMYSCTRGPAGEHGMAPSFLGKKYSTLQLLSVNIRIPPFLNAKPQLLRPPEHSRFYPINQLHYPCSFASDRHKRCAKRRRGSEAVSDRTVRHQRTVSTIIHPSRSFLANCIADLRTSHPAKYIR